MTDHADVIAAIHAALDTRSGVAIPYAIGNVQAETMSAPPRVVWAEADAFAIEPSASFGSHRTVGTYVGGWTVYIWGSTASQAKAILFNLIQASRSATDGLPLVWESGTNISENTGEWAKRGVLLQVSCKLSVPILSEPYQVTAAETSPDYVTITVASTELTGATIP